MTPRNVALQKIFIHFATFHQMFFVIPRKGVQLKTFNIMDNIVPIVAIISTFGSVILFVSLLTNYSLKRKLIDKDMVNSESAKLFNRQEGKQSSLKWGLIILFGGLGLILIDAMGLDGDDAMPYGIEAVCIAIGFLVYYFMIRKEMDQS